MNMTHINDDTLQVNIRTFNGSVADLVTGHFKIKSTTDRSRYSNRKIPSKIQAIFRIGFKNYFLLNLKRNPWSP